MTEEQIEQRYIETLSIPEKAIKDIPVLRDDYTFNKLKQYLISHGIRIQEETFYKNFGLCGIVEHSGHGVPIVVREYGEKAYTFSENMITVTIPFDKPEIKSGEITGEIKLKENEESIYEVIKENPFISRQKLIEKCEVSKNTLDKILKKLKEKGLIKGRTSNRNGQWII